MESKGFLWILAWLRSFAFQTSFFYISRIRERVKKLAEKVLASEKLDLRAYKLERLLVHRTQ